MELTINKECLMRILNLAIATEKRTMAKEKNKYNVSVIFASKMERILGFALKNTIRDFNMQVEDFSGAVLNLQGVFRWFSKRNFKELKTVQNIKLKMNDVDGDYDKELALSFDTFQATTLCKSAEYQAKKEEEERLQLLKSKKEQLERFVNNQNAYKNHIQEELSGSQPIWYQVPTLLSEVNLSVLFEHQKNILYSDYGTNTAFYFTLSNLLKNKKDSIFYDALYKQLTNSIQRLSYETKNNSLYGVESVKEVIADYKELEGHDVKLVKKSEEFISELELFAKPYIDNINKVLADIRCEFERFLKEPLYMFDMLSKIINNITIDFNEDKHRRRTNSFKNFIKNCGTIKQILENADCEECYNAAEYILYRINLIK